MRWMYPHLMTAKHLDLFDQPSRHRMNREDVQSLHSLSITKRLMVTPYRVYDFANVLLASCLDADAVGIVQCGLVPRSRLEGQQSAPDTGGDTR
jgi:hypothetical protein